MMKVVKGLKRVQRQNVGSPPHYCYWIAGATVGGVQSKIFAVVQELNRAVSCKEVALRSGLSEGQVSTNSSKLSDKKLVKRSISGGLLYLRPSNLPSSSGHCDYGFGMLRNHKCRNGELKEKPVEPATKMQNPVSRRTKDDLGRPLPGSVPMKGEVLLSFEVTRGTTVTLMLHEAQTLYAQMKELFK